MGLTLSNPPGFSDLSDTLLAHDLPILGFDVGKMYENAVFGLARTEVFQGLYKDGDTVPLPISPIDGYVYSADELIFFWVPAFTGDASSGWITGKDSPWFFDWLVDQTTGKVYSTAYYIGSTQGKGTKTNDGELLVITIAQRAKTSLIMSAVPTWTDLESGSPLTGWIGDTLPFSEQLAKALNHDGKFAVTKNEVFYCSEFYHGQTVPLQSSPVDSYSYSRAETKYLFSWRWVGVAGNTATLQQPPAGRQLGPMDGSINASTGVVSLNQYYQTDEGTLIAGPYHDNRIAVFAFCQRSATPASFSTVADNFSEVDENLFMPGSPLESDTLSQMFENAKQSVLTPEFFGPTVYQDGNTVALPTSPVDGYVYSRSELYYIWNVTQESSGAYPPGTTDHDRLVLWNCAINQTTGAVSLDIWRLAPGGPYIDAHAGQMRVTVLTVARRKAQAVSATTGTTTNPQSDSSTAVTDVPSLAYVQIDDLSASCNSSNTSFSLSKTPKAMACLVWNGQVRFDFSWPGGSPSSNTAVSTSFTPDPGDNLYAFYFL